MSDTTAVNRLAGETSLYLRQHARNPVDWYPWGEEAIRRARELDRPIFLSVGYSACHWCHVMEHESFENPEIAKVLNDHFVSVKVDREERPDLDQIYMTAHQLLTREGGGWPLSVFLTPDLTPFFAGTYFPPDDRYAPHRPSFPKLLAAIVEAWQTKRDQLAEVGRQVAEHLSQMGESEAAEGDLSDALLRNALRALKRSHDPVHGGFGHQPKFPHAVDLRLLLRVARRFDADDAVQMVRLTLEKMARGGMYDQVGGGFHRYSVDAHWLVPHFEKMLYDNALLPPAYVEAFQLTGDPFYRHVACETLDYVLREMTSPAGAFYSTQDADSEGEEGKFYVWSEKEIDDILGDELAPLAKSVFGVTGHGNFEGHNILFRSKTDEQDARLNRLGLEEFRDKLGRIKCKLYGERAKRVWPGRDEKILTSWNGLMIAAFAQAGAVLGVPKYVEAAVKAADFVLTRMRDPGGRLYRTAGADQPPKLAGYLEDYAYSADALVTLYEATFDPRWLRAAIELAEVMLKHFADERGGGFFYTADDHERLIARTKDLHDGSLPSGNAMAVTALLRLAALTGRRDFRDRAVQTLKAYRGLMDEHPAAAGQMLVALDFHLGPVDEVAIVGPKGDPETERVLAAVRSKFRPGRVVAFHDPAAGPPPPEVGLLADKPMRGTVTTYVCRDFACREPLLGAEAAEQAL
jgi:uncharacterized protein YyaL (SSP411 family)